MKTVTITLTKEKLKQPGLLQDVLMSISKKPRLKALTITYEQSGFFEKDSVIETLPEVKIPDDTPVTFQDGNFQYFPVTQELVNPEGEFIRFKKSEGDIFLKLLKGEIVPSGVRKSAHYMCQLRRTIKDLKLNVRIRTISKTGYMLEMLD